MPQNGPSNAWAYIVDSTLRFNDNDVPIIYDCCVAKGCKMQIQREITAWDKGENEHTHSFKSKPVCGWSFSADVYMTKSDSSGTLV